MFKERKTPNPVQMEKSFDKLSERAMDEIPISIGTALAIQELNNLPASKGVYESLWINSNTLIRNIYQAMDKDHRDSILPEAIADVLIEELGIIRRELKRVGKVVVYNLNYRNLEKEFPKALIRDPYKGGTALQIKSQQMIDDTVACLHQYHKDKVIWEDGCSISGEPTKSLIMTSNAVDLLSRTKFKQLRLLESYTGAVKSRSQWNSKLTNGKKLPFLPFNKFTIQIFGDGNNQFNQFPIKIRDPIISLASKHNWSPLTTVDKIRWNINKMADRFSAEILKGFL